MVYRQFVNNKEYDEFEFKETQIILTNTFYFSALILDSYFGDVHQP